MKRLVWILSIVGILIVGKAAYAQQSQSYLVYYKQLLSNHVYESEKAGVSLTVVDYEAWGKSPNHLRAMEEINHVNPQQLSGVEVMVYWINVYNLLTIDLIISTGETESIKNQGSFLRNVWKKHSWKLYGKRYTLHEIEHDILRPMGDPRIHMAINCASISCPDLRREPYNAAIIDAQLDEQVRTFLSNDAKGLRLQGNQMLISPIFKWFKGDFGGEDGVLAFVRKYRADIPEDTEISGYLDYDWGLNGRGFLR